MLFGVAMIGHGFAKNWQTLAGLRVPLGAFEGFLFPGSIFLISSWYPRYEVQKRISAFYLSGASFVSGTCPFESGRLAGQSLYLQEC